MTLVVRTAGLTLVAATLACTPGGDDAPAIEFRVPVTVRDIGTGSVEDLVVVTGTLRAERSVALRAETGGALLVAKDAQGRRLVEGAVVRAGQLLAEITGEDVRVAARREANEQRYAATRSDYESKQRLHAEGMLSEFELRQAETALAEAKLEAERSQLTEARSRLVTPIGGVLLRLASDEQGQPMADGQLVQQGLVVAQVAPTAELVADVDLLGADVLRVRPGQVARVRHPGWKDRGFEGSVVRMAPTVDATTRTLRAEVRVDNAEGVLRPGMFVEVAIVIERREAVTVVPRSAIAEREGRSWVFVLNGQKVDRHAVVLGLGDDETVEVREGVTPGQRVVVRGIETLTDGAKVRVSGT